MHSAGVISSAGSFTTSPLRDSAPLERNSRASRLDVQMPEAAETELRAKGVQIYKAALQEKDGAD